MLELITFQDLRPGIQQATMNLDLLYREPKDRARFLARFELFMGSDPANPEFYSKVGNSIVYRTECIVPDVIDTRPPLLLLFGNPASHSVSAEMFFAHEGSGREHRLWPALKKAGVLSFPSDGSIFSSMSSHDINQVKKKRLFELRYDSPYRIGFAVFYSMPSTASGYPWAGVAGLYRLLGKRAFDKISLCEKGRVEGIIGRFVSGGGAVIAFQKHAYLGIKSSASPNYSLPDAMAGRLLGTCECAKEVKLLCCPPTRRAHGEKAVAVLRQFISRC